MKNNIVVPNSIHNESCLDTMGRMADGLVDLTVTSPPYNLGKNHHTGNTRHTPYKDDMPEDEYQRWQIEVLDSIYRVTSEAGSLLYNHKNRIKNGSQITPYSWLLKTKWIVKQEVVWFNRSQNFDKIRFYPMTERVYWLAKSPKTTLFNAINHHDVFGKEDWNTVGVSGQSHTRAFPEKMVSDLVSCFPNAKIVYDPFMGSGTTPFVAKTRGLSFIGSEIVEEYFRLAQERLGMGA